MQRTVLCCWILCPFQQHFTSIEEQVDPTLAFKVALKVWINWLNVCLCARWETLVGNLRDRKTGGSLPLISWGKACKQAREGEASLKTCATLFRCQVPRYSGAALANVTRTRGNQPGWDQEGNNLWHIVTSHICCLGRRSLRNPDEPLFSRRFPLDTAQRVWWSHILHSSPYFWTVTRKRAMKSGLHDLLVPQITKIYTFWSLSMNLATGLGIFVVKVKDQFKESKRPRNWDLWT